MDWIEPTLKDISDCLFESDVAKHSEGYEFGALFSQITELSGLISFQKRKYSKNTDNYDLRGL